VRAARILLGRQIAHNVVEHPQSSPSPRDSSAPRRTTELTTR